MVNTEFSPEKIYPESEAKSIKSLKKWFNISRMRVTSSGSGNFLLESDFFYFAKTLSTVFCTVILSLDGSNWQHL
jgi:hypothetical protein